MARMQASLLYFACGCLALQRVAMLCGYGALNGGNLGTLVILAEVIDPSVVPTALFATVTVFACFSGAALFGTTTARPWSCDPRRLCVRSCLASHC